MTIVTDVWFAHKTGALAGTLGDLSALDVPVIKEVSTDPKQHVYFFRFDDTSLDELRPVLEDDPTVRTIRSMPSFDDQVLVGIEFEPDTKLLGPKVTNAGGYVLEARGQSGGNRPPGWYERWSLPDHDSVHSIWQDARREGFEFEIIELQSYERVGEGASVRGRITEQQRTALIAAFEAGYFAEPRETSLEALADQLDISPSAVAGRIRRGLKSLVGETLVVDRTDR